MTDNFNTLFKKINSGIFKMNFKRVPNLFIFRIQRITLVSFLKIFSNLFFMTRTRGLIIALLFIFSSCSSSKSSQDSKDISHLKFLSSYIIPYNYQYNHTTVGGLSGIDYNPVTNEYYCISDDRSDKNAARFYTMGIRLNDNKIDSVYFLKSTFLKDRDGKEYPSSQQNPYRTPDPECLRFDRNNNTFIWGSEGEKIVSVEKNILVNPAITMIDSQGNFIDTFSLPRQLLMTAGNYGPRRNGVFEGLTFLDDYQSLLVSVEEPLLQDGREAGIGDSSGVVRMIKFDIASRKPVAQYAYKIDPVAHPPLPSSGFRINGISDILSFEKDKLLVVERSFSAGRLSCTIKVYLASLEKATNVQSFDSLKEKNNFQLISKKLLLNMDDLGIYIDNIEGITFGPRLPDGKRSFIFIADNNFNPLEQSQVLLFEVE